VAIGFGPASLEVTARDLARDCHGALNAKEVFCDGLEPERSPNGLLPGVTFEVWATGRRRRLSWRLVGV